MATLKVFDQESGSTSGRIYFNLKEYSITGAPEIILIISTNLRKPDNTSIGDFIVRDLTDVPPTYSTALTLNELCKDYIEYIVGQLELGQSSSSSSEGYSSSSSSSSEEYSSSSSS